MSVSSETVSLIVGGLFGSTGVVTYFLSRRDTRKVQAATNQLTLNAQNVELTKTAVETMDTLNRQLVAQLAERDDIVEKQVKQLAERDTIIEKQAARIKELEAK